MELSTLINDLKNAEFSLFLGAGASVPCGGPTSTELLETMRRKYPLIGQENDFFRAMDLILPDDSRRKDVEDYLKLALSTMTPTSNHRYLFSMPWKAVITTNYDRIPDSITTTLDGSRIVSTLVGQYPRSDYRIEEHLYCFKIFGDMSHSYRDQGHMVLTNKDRRRTYAQQANFFELFGDFARSGNIIYLGYSFKDELVFDILGDMLHELKGLTHRGYAITPEKPSELFLQKMNNLNIEWVEGTLESFVEEAIKIFGVIPKSCTLSTFPIKIHGKIIDIDRATYSNIRGKAKIVHQGLFDSLNDNPRLFFEGKDQSFVPFQKKWDFPRKWKLLHIKPNVKKEWFEKEEQLINSRSKTGNPADNLKYALIGSAGSGKSVVGKRIAYDWYLGGNPVIFLEPTNAFLDKTAIENLMDEIWANYRRTLKHNELPKEVRYLIICDNGSFLLSDINQLASELMSTGKPADILVIDRSSELPTKVLEDMGFDAVFSLDDTVTREERLSFIEYYQEKDVFKDTAVIRGNIENPTINTSFFALMYTTIREAQISLKDIIINEYKNKPPAIQRVYALVSLVQSFGLELCFSLLTKTCGMDFNKIIELLQTGPLVDILYYDQHEESIKANHRIVADIVREYAFSTNDILCTGLSRMSSVITDGNAVEMNIMQKLLINCEELRRSLNQEQLEGLFNTTLSKIQTRPLFLHLARIQLERGGFNECRNSLKLAADTKHPLFPEPISHVFDVQGRLELAIANDYVLNKDETRAWVSLEKAESAFKQAQTESINVNPHPYLGLAQTYNMMSSLQANRCDAIRFCIYSLTILDRLKINAPEDFNLNVTYNVERAIFTNLSKTKFDENDAKYLYDSNKNADGYAFLAENGINEGHPDDALILVNKGLALNSSIWLIRIKVNLLKKSPGEALNEISETLSLYQPLLERYFDFQLTFELAKIRFMKEYWNSSKKIFDELSKKSKGYSLRLIPGAMTDRWFEGNHPKKLIGTLEKIPVPAYEQWGQIISISPEIPYPIPVRYRDIQYERYARKDIVKFEIVFNMTGPQASNVTLE